MAKDFVTRMTKEKVTPMIRWSNGRLNGKWKFTKDGITLPCDIPNVMLGVEADKQRQEQYLDNEMTWLLGDSFDNDLTEAMAQFGMTQDEQGNYEYDATDENMDLTELEPDENGMLKFSEDEGECWLNELEI